MKAINASDLKARCLATLDEVERTGTPLAISKRGRIVAEVSRPGMGSATAFPQTALRGTGRTLGDIVGPALPAKVWEALAPRQRS